MALLRPKRPLPKKFSRRVSPAMRSFARRRHQRRSLRSSQHLRKLVRRSSAAFLGVWEWLRHWWYVLAIAILVICTSVVFLSPLFRVRGIRIQRAQGRVDVAAVQKKPTPLLGQHLLFISSHDVTEAVRHVVPDVESVDIQKRYPSLLFLRISVKPLIARLMFEEPKSQTQSPPSTATGSLSGPNPNPNPEVPRYDYLTDNGLFVSTFSAQSGSALPVFRVVDWGVRPIPGKQLFSPEFLDRMRQTELILQREFGQKVTARTVFLRAQEFHLSIGRLMLWFDTQSMVEEQFKRYRTFLRTVNQNEVTQYVDLRLAGRVVYR